MSTTVVLLRAINVGGHNKIPMAELRQLLADLGFDDVATYLQSGNAVCTSDMTHAAIGSTIHDGIAERFGLDIRVLVRSAEQLAQVVAAFPYADCDPKQSAVIFLGERFDGDLDASAFAPDECVVDGEHVFIHCPTSFARTKLTNVWVEKQTGISGTSRNWNTVLKLANMAGVDAAVFEHHGSGA